MLNIVVLVILVAFSCNFTFLLEVEASSPFNKVFKRRLSMVADGKQAVEIYSRKGCKYCRIARANLLNFGLNFKNIDIEEVVESASDEAESLRIRKAKSSTVPQIYVGEDHIGGCTELLNEIKSGIFVSRLQKKGIFFRMPDSVQADPGPSSSISTPLSHASVNSSISTPLPHGSVNNVKAGLNSFGNIAICAADLETPVDYSMTLQRKALELTDLYATSDGLRVDYARLRQSQEFKSFVDYSAGLKYLTFDKLVQSLSDSQRLCFFVNVYNALIIHAAVALGPPADSQAARGEFFTGKSGALYEICSDSAARGSYESGDPCFLFSPDDIEHGIIRANVKHPSQTEPMSIPAIQNQHIDSHNFLSSVGTYFNAADLRTSLSLSRLDPRIHFVLNCGAQSCPPIRLLGAGINNVTTSIPDLAVAAAAYLEQEVSVDVERKVLRLPRLILWYGADFGKDDISRVKTLLSLLRPEYRDYVHSQLVQIGIDFASGGNDLVTWPESVSIEYNVYHWNFN